MSPSDFDPSDFDKVSMQAEEPQGTSEGALPNKPTPLRPIIWILAEIKYLARVLLSSAERFYWDDGFSKAASLAYSTLFALVPITTICFAFLASFHSLEAFLPGVQKFIFRQFIPSTVGGDQVFQYLGEFSQTVASLNVVAIPFLLITAILLLNSIEYALNRVWQVYESRTVAHRMAIFCAILVLAPIMAISAYYTTQFRVQPIVDSWLASSVLLVRIYQFLLPFLIDFASFVALYYLVPKAPVLARAALTGAFFGAFLFDLAKSQFAIYIATFTSYEKVYGTIAVIPIFLFWLYLAWVIVLFGAEISYQAQHLPRTGRLWKRTLLSIGDGRLLLAVQTLVLLGRAFLRGEPLPNELELAERLGCSSLVLKPVLEDLKRGKIIARSDSREMSLTLLKNPDKIGLHEVSLLMIPQAPAGVCSREVSLVFGELKRNPNLTLADVIA